MIYFDNAATSHQKPKEVMEQVISSFEKFANPGRSGHYLAVDNGIKIEQLRFKIAKFFSLQRSDRIIFTKNCTEALNIGILGTLRKGGHIITSQNEHNSVLRPIEHLKKLNLVDVTYLPPQPNGEILLSDVKKAIRRNTYLVAINHVSNVTGGTSDLKGFHSFFKNHDIIFLADIAQSAGHIDIDWASDLMCAPMHKGLLGLMGLGFLYVSEKVSKLSPILFGGTGSSSHLLDQPHSIPDGFESGTQNLPAIYGSFGAFDYLEKNFSEIKENMRDLTEHFKEIRKIPNVTVFSHENLCGIVSILKNGYSSSELSDKLNEKYHIATRSGLTCAPLIHKHLETLDSGVTRISFSHFNTHAEIDYFLKALNEI